MNEFEEIRLKYGRSTPGRCQDIRAKIYAVKMQLNKPLLCSTLQEAVINLKVIADEVSSIFEHTKTCSDCLKELSGAFIEEKER